MSRCRAPTSPSARVPPSAFSIALHEAVPQGTPEAYPNKPSVVHNGSTGDENCGSMAVNNPVAFIHALVDGVDLKAAGFARAEERRRPSRLCARRSVESLCRWPPEPGAVEPPGHGGRDRKSLNAKGGQDRIFGAVRPFAEAART